MPTDLRSNDDGALLPLTKRRKLAPRKVDEALSREEDDGAWVLVCGVVGHLDNFKLHRRVRSFRCRRPGVRWMSKLLMR